MREFVILLVLISFYGCKPEKSTTNQEEIKVTKQKINVFSKKVSEGIFNYQLVANGKIEAKFKNNFSFKTSNYLAKISVKNGQKINKGQFLASLENSLLKNNLNKAEIDLLKAKNKLVEEKINYNQSNINPEILNKLEIKSGLLEAKNNFQKAKIEYEQTILRAPFSGVIANLEKKQGDFVSASDIFCTIINQTVLEVSFSIIESEYDFVKKGQEIQIQSFGSKNDVNFTGVITEINPMVDKNGLIKIKAQVMSKNTKLLDGMHVKIFINKPINGALIIPKEAMVLRSNREVVFTIEKGLAKWNYVEIAGENSNSYAIKKGLKPTDTVIVSGNLNLSHDAIVEAKFLK